MSSPKAPSPPKGLADQGRGLWKKLAAEFEFDDRELAILAAACRQLDVVSGLEDAAKKDGPMTTGSQGQPVLHPAIAEARQGRLALSRLLGQLEIPDEEDAPRSQASIRAQKAANKRWTARRTTAARRG